MSFIAAVPSRQAASRNLLHESQYQTVLAGASAPASKKLTPKLHQPFTKPMSTGYDVHHTVAELGKIIEEIACGMFSSIVVLLNTLPVPCRMLPHHAEADVPCCCRGQPWPCRTARSTYCTCSSDRAIWPVEEA